MTIKKRIKHTTITANEVTVNENGECVITALPPVTTVKNVTEKNARKISAAATGLDKSRTFIVTSFSTDVVEYEMSVDDFLRYAKAVET